MMSAQKSLSWLIKFLALCLFIHSAQARYTSDENPTYQVENSKRLQGSYISADEAKSTALVSLNIEPNKPKHPTLMPRRSKQFGHTRALPMQVSDNISTAENLSTEPQKEENDELQDSDQNSEEDLEQISAEEIIFNQIDSGLHSDFLPISLNY